jgi:hypothetical protein
MKNKIPLILTALGGAYLVFWLRRKAQAGANIQFIPLDIAIDSRRSGLFRIYYSIKLRLINNESANVNIRGINLKAFIDNKFVGDIVNTASFNVPAKGTTDIKLDTSISTGSVARLIFNAITEGINFSMNVSGFVDTDLGRVNVNFTKQVGEQGINAPIILAGDKFTLTYKKKVQPVGKKIKDVYKYIVNSLNTGSKLSDFELTSEQGTIIPGEIFFDQAQNAPYDFADYTKN